MPKRPRIVIQMEPEKLPQYYELAKKEERTLSQLVRHLLNKRLEERNGATT